MSDYKEDIKAEVRGVINWLKKKHPQISIQDLKNEIRVALDKYDEEKDV